jgi:Zn ribbon nucleic-acid-binding protein
MANDIGVRTGCDTQSEQKIFSNGYNCPSCGSDDITPYVQNGVHYFKCNCCGAVHKNNLL